MVQYAGDVDGQLKLAYGSCDSDAETWQRIGSTHVGQHPLAARHLDHEDKRPTSFVWVVPSDSNFLLFEHVKPNNAAEKKYSDE